MDISVPYYSDMGRISNSNIGWFLNKGPTYLHNMLTGKEQGDTGAQLDKGTMIHEYLLRPEDFAKEYILFTGNKPSSAQQEKFCKDLMNSTEIETNKAVLKAYRKSYSVVGKADKDILTKGLEMASTLKEYVNISRNCEQNNLIMYSMAESMLLSKIYNNITEHKLAYKLFYPDDPDEEWYHEFHINWEQYTKNGVVKCKSLLDHISFNKKKKICTIVDLKTSVHVNNFELSMEQYDYYRQITYYENAAKWYIVNVLGEDPNLWTFTSYIVAVDSIKGETCRVFKLDFENDIAKKRESWHKILYALTEIAWHISNNLWEHTREYYEGDGSEKLKNE